MNASPTAVLACPACGTRNRVPAAASGAPRCGKCNAALPWVADADETNFTEVAERSSIPVILDLWAPWCGPCRTVSPILEQLATDLAGRCKLVKVNVDTAPQLSDRFAVQGIPTLLLLRDGREVARQVGAAPAARLRDWIETSLRETG